MKKSRKRIALCIAALTMAAALPVYAQETTQTETTKLSASVDSKYTLTIPQDTSIVFNRTSTELNGTLKVTGNVDTDEKVVVTALSGALHNNTHGVDLPYTLKTAASATTDTETTDTETTDTETKAFTEAEWSESELRAGQTETGKEIQLFIGITEDAWKAAKAGSYEGTITFTATLTKQTEQPGETGQTGETE